MARVTVELSGFSELEAELAKISKAAGKGALRRAGIKAMQPMAAIAADMAPKDTGDLSASIIVSAKASALNDVGRRAFARTMRGGGTRSEALAALRTARRNANGGRGKAAVELFMGPVRAANADDAIKAMAQEFGTFRHSPNPYMRPAWDQDKMDMLERLKTELWAEVSKTVERAERRAAARAARAARRSARGG